MFYCLYNGHADITGMVDETGKLSEKYYYDEWGLETETLKYGDVTGDGNVNINDYSLLKKYILDKGAKSVKICTLLDKPDRRVPEIKDKLTTDYTGAIIPDEFVVGYGLDYNEKYRNLPYVGVLKREVYEK